MMSTYPDMSPALSLIDLLQREREGRGGVTNRLEDSMSPYLRQHADDPVDWFPWGDEAFARAKESDRPVLLSCGYSACHWCHVMQRESFRDERVSALMNGSYVSVKVDRELRPDVDAVYQDYVAASTGSGGWPLTVWLTPNRLPVFGGTYFATPGRAGAIPFVDALTAVADSWDSDRQDVERTAAQALAFLRERSSRRPEGPIDRPMLDASAELTLQIQDTVHGGLRGATKFPQLPMVEFMCAYARLVPDIELLLAIERTMLAIVRGGIFDHVGGGVHRYATDETWRVPHFEKMLYDQGLLLSALASAAPFASSDGVREEYAHAARATARFMTSELSLPDGGFAASLSADTDGVEGATYTWTHAQLAEGLDLRGLELAEAGLGAPTEDGDESLTLHRPGGRGADAQALDAVLAQLARARAMRPQPERDGKRLTAWNAIAARGLIEAGRTFGSPEMVDDGLATVRWLTRATAREDGVVREPDDTSVKDVRLLEDAAHLVAALLTAADATGDPGMLASALALHAGTLERFADGTSLYMTPALNDLPLRPREGGDSATPAGSSTTIENAVRLGLATGDASHLAFARAALRQMWAIADFAPDQAGRSLAAAVALELAGA
jgi:hypothetical protein